MKKILVYVSLVIYTCCVQQEPMNKIVYSEKAKQDILLGEINRSGLLTDQFKDWFNREYNSYEVGKETLDSISIESWDDVKITIILATWCPDSKRELPRFLKILDYLEYPEENITYISVNRDKLVPGMDLANLNMKKVPTMIFYRAGNEIGRIIESPVQSLEKDIKKFMNN